MTVPARITSGESLSWTTPATSVAGKSISPSSGWTLSHTFRGQVQGGNVDVTATQQNDGWVTSLTSQQTQAMSDNLTPCMVWWSAWAVNGTQRINIGKGELVVDVDLTQVSTSDTYDGRTAAEKTLAAINAEINRRINGGAVIEYSIGSRQLKRETMTALHELRTRYLLIVRNEKRRRQSANGQGASNQIGVRFTGGSR